MANCLGGIYFYDEGIDALKDLTQEEKSLLWLDSFLLEPTFKRLLLQTAGSAVALVKGFAKHRALFSDEKTFQEMQATLANGDYFAAVKARLESKGILPIFCGEEGYPTGWLSLQDAPICLYAKGNVRLLQRRMFTVVGSRRTTEGARKLGQTIAKDLSGCFAVVTGSADGGDEAALKGALEADSAVCLLAGGFGACPKENVLLADVEKKGLLLAACPYDMPVRVYSYEYRNKLLAAMSEGVLVLGAAKKSGALITAKYAKEFDKKVFAIPYAPSVAAGEGCNALIKAGAYLTETASDVLGQYGLTVASKQSVVLTDTEKSVLNTLTELGDAHVTELSKASGIPTFKLTTILSSLEVKGVVVKLGGNRYSVV